MRDPVWKLYFALAVFLATGAAAWVWLDHGREKTLRSMAYAPPRDDPQRLRWLTRSAAQGAPVAMVNLAYMHEQGWGGLARDSEAAWRLRRKAALETGHPLAMRALAVDLLERWPEGSSGAAEGLEWMRKAAATGDRMALTSLGLIHAEGAHGERKDFAEAARLCRLAAGERFGPGLYCLALLHERGGPGLTQDRAEALRLYERVSTLRYVAPEMREDAAARAAGLREAGS